MAKNETAPAAPRLSKLERLQQELAAAEQAQKTKVQKKYDDTVVAHSKALVALDAAEKKVAAVQAELDAIVTEAGSLGLVLAIAGEEIEAPVAEAPAEDIVED